MSTIKGKLFATFAMALFAAGCAGTPENPSAPDRSPRWLRDSVTGSRIPRPVDSRGNPEGTSGTLVTTTPQNLGYLPGVTIVRR